MKKYLSILMMLMLVFGMMSVLGACSNDDAVAEEVPEEEEVMEGESSKSFIDELGNEEIEDLYVRTPDNSNPHIYLVRDGYYYSLDSRFNNEGLNDSAGADAGYGERIVYCDSFDFSEKQKGFYSYGYVSIPIMSSEDEIVSCHPREVMTLRLAKVDYYGKALSMRLLNTYGDRYELHCFDDYDTNKIIIELGVTDLVVKDSDGNAVDDYYNVEGSGAYEVSWYSNTDGEYKTRSVYADANAFVFKPGFEFEGTQYDYVIEGATTNANGYSSYDLSDVAPGIYKVYGEKCGGGIIIIK